MVEANDKNKEKKKAPREISYGHLYIDSIKELIEKEDWQKAMRECGTSKSKFSLNLCFRTLKRKQKRFLDDTQGVLPHVDGGPRPVP
jgi:hypothetical protein